MFGKTLFTRSATNSAAPPTSQFQPEPSPRRLFKRPLTFLRKVCDLQYLFRQARSQEETKGARLQENGSPEPWLQAHSDSPQDFEHTAGDDPRPQTPLTGLPALGLSTTELSTLLSVKAGEESSATSTPPTTFSAATSAHLGTPPSVPTTPTSTFASGPSSLHSSDQHPDLLAVNQRIAELEALAEQIEQEHGEYVKNARYMEAISTALEEEVVSVIDAIKAVNKKTTLEDEENLKWDIERLEEIRYREIAESTLEDAKRTYEEGQKKYADLQARFENLQRECEQRRVDLKNAAPPSEPWLEIISTALAPNLLGGVALGIGHVLGPLMANAF